jgi:hypothetical protein
MVGAIAIRVQVRDSVRADPVRAGAIEMRHLVSLLLPALVASSAPAQVWSAPDCVTPQSGNTIYPAQPLTYPMTSDEYAVEVQAGVNGQTSSPRVYISKYGGSNSSPHLSYSHYKKLTAHQATSMSFVSIPVDPSGPTIIWVHKLRDGKPVRFKPGDGVSVRPGAKGITSAFNKADGSVRIERPAPPADFQGEQFILWWNRNPNQSGAVQGLAFFLNPGALYKAPSGARVIRASSDLAAIAATDTALDFEAPVAIDMIGSTEPVGSQAFPMPGNISTIYLGREAWVQGKFLFPSTSHVKIYGPGVLDVSRFRYDLRQCPAKDAYAEQGYPALNAQTSTGGHSALDGFTLDGIVITDNNFYATALLTNSTVNNVKVIAWNGNNDGLEFGDNTTVSNVFVRSGDDSLKMWGSNIAVTNATVWQNYNGGVVNLGWSSTNAGENSRINGLYVVKTDWFTPTTATFDVFDTDILAHQNNAVIASMMVPGTGFGSPTRPISVYQNIYLDDPPQVLLSLKIVPPRSNANTLSEGPSLMLTNSSFLSLNIVNLVTPASVDENLIGFDNLKAPFVFGCKKPSKTCTTPFQKFKVDTPLTGVMYIQLTNLIVGGTLITSANASSVGKIMPSGPTVSIRY